jgi:leader peptidase (prepilin peptidase) / N-methyltransferase
MDPLLVAGCAAGGFVMGDLAEPLADRLPKKMALDRPWWRCVSCGEPAASRFAFAGSLHRAARCRACGEPRHGHRPLVQAVATGAVLAGMAVRFGPDAVLAAYAVVGIALVAISIIDIEVHMVPNRIVYPAGLVAALLLVVAASVDHDWTALWHSAASAGIGFTALYLIRFIYPRGMGFGDVRLAAIVGGASGWFGFRAVFIAFFLSFLLGSVGGITQIALTGGNRKTQFGFAPYLALGTIVVVIFTSPVLRLFHPLLFRS